jgi:hypothetical protein
MWQWHAIFKHTLLYSLTSQEVEEHWQIVGRAAVGEALPHGNSTPHTGRGRGRGRLPGGGGSASRHTPGTNTTQVGDAAMSY